MQMTHLRLLCRQWVHLMLIVAMAEHCLVRGCLVIQLRAQVPVLPRIHVRIRPGG